MVDLPGLEIQVSQGDANRPLQRRQMVWLIRRLRSLFSDVDRRLDAIEEAPVLTLNVVANAAALPAAAGARQWFRVVGDPAVYVGNGVGRPLTKLTPV